jgi:hypothetical protein
MAILGSLRYGKPLVVDMMEVDMYNTISNMFDRLMPGLLKAIVDKSIIQNEKSAQCVCLCVCGLRGRWCCVSVCVWGGGMVCG